MKKKILIAALGTVLAGGNAIAQINTTNVFPIPEGFKAVSTNISANGQLALVGVEKAGAIKYLYFKKSNGKFVENNDPNPLNALASKNITPMNPSLSGDGSKIYFAADNGGNTDIYVIAKTNGKWGEHQSLGDSINTSANEQYPAISPDGNTIYFTRLKDDAADKRCGVLFLSSKNAKGQWSKAKDAPEPVNLGCEAAPYVCPDNKTIYMASIREGGKGGFDIVYTQRPNEKAWVIPIPVDTVNSQGNEMSPTFDYETQEMYLIGRDAKKNETTCKAEIPGNLKHEKISRYFGKTLDKYTNKPLEAEITIKDAFSSQVLATFGSDAVTGEYDFFLNQKTPLFIDFSYPNYSHAIVETTPNGQENKEDYKIFNKVNLQLNVFDSEMFEALSSDIKISVDGKKQDIKLNEFSKGRYKMELPVGKNFRFDIDKELYNTYNFNLDLSQVVIFESFERDAELVSNKAKVKFKVNGLEGGATAEITIVDLSTETKYTTSVITDEQGNAGIDLRKGDKYQVSIIKKGYSMFNQTFDIDKPEYTVNANITKLAENVKIEIPNVNFETASSVLDPSSYESLNSVVSLLKMNSDVKIELSAHTDNKGAKNYNMKLSDQRAASVAAYLINKGINKDRIVSKGYGFDQPIADNNTEEGRAKNRRVELKILGTVSNQ